MLKVYILVCDRCGRMFDGLEESFNIMDEGDICSKCTKEENDETEHSPAVS
jgi:hypothetical protein